LGIILIVPDILVLGVIVSGTPSKIAVQEVEPCQDEGVGVGVLVGDRVIVGVGIGVGVLVGVGVGVGGIVVSIGVGVRVKIGVGVGDILKIIVSSFVAPVE